MVYCTIYCTIIVVKEDEDMPSINYSNARQNFKELISKVNEDSVTYTIINERR